MSRFLTLLCFVASAFFSSLQEAQGLSLPQVQTSISATGHFTASRKNGIDYESLEDGLNETPSGRQADAMASDHWIQQSANQATGTIHHDTSGLVLNAHVSKQTIRLVDLGRKDDDDMAMKIQKAYGHYDPPVQSPSEIEARAVGWMSQFLSHCLGATLLVLLLCGDDLVLLFPFLQGNDRYRKALFYVGCMGFMWFIAYFVHFVVKYAQRARPDIPVEWICNVLSTILLFMLTIKFFTEWYYEAGDDDAEAEDTPVQKPESCNVEASAKNAAAPETCQEDDKNEAAPETYQEDDKNEAAPEACQEDDKNEVAQEICQKDKNEFAQEICQKDFIVTQQKCGYDATKEWKHSRKFSYLRLFVVTLTVNFDTVSANVPIMIAGVFTPLELLVGMLCAGCILVMITFGLSQCQMLTDIVAQIPLWVIFGCLTIAVPIGCV